MILGQTQNNEERVLAYAGRTLTKPERNYTVTEQEALAVIVGVKHFSSYLHGRKFTIHTDHSSLKWLFTTKDLKGRAARWALVIQGYDFDIKHRPGTANQHAEALLRLQPAVFTCDTTGYTPDAIYHRQRREPSLLQLILYLESQEPYTSPVPPELGAVNAPNFFLTNDGILYKHREPPKSYDPDSVLVIPDNLREEILINAHDSPLAGHFVFQKTYAKIKTNYWWPLMYSQIHEWCATCEPCLKRKRPYGKKVAPLQPLPIGMAFDRIAMDILGPLPLTKSGNKYIIVFSDYRTKWPEATCLPSIEAHKVAPSFFNLIITRHGAPQRGKFPVSAYA